MDGSDRLRLDKWLWAARFYKTRSLAKAAVDGGKVHLNGARVKPAKEVGPGDELSITRGDVEQTVIVATISARRGSASIAATLYKETEESIVQRERQRAERRMLAAGLRIPKTRPNKRQRRTLRGLRRS